MSDNKFLTEEQRDHLSSMIALLPGVTPEVAKQWGNSLPETEATLSSLDELPESLLRSMELRLDFYLHGTNASLGQTKLNKHYQKQLMLTVSMALHALKMLDMIQVEITKLSEDNPELALKLGEHLKSIGFLATLPEEEAGE